MITEELIKTLNANKWAGASLITEEESQDYISICGPFNKEVLRVPINATAWFDVKMNLEAAHEEFGITGREFISSTVNKYLDTPLNERKAEKKCRLVVAQSSWRPWILGAKLNDSKDEYIWSIGNEGYLNGEGYKTKFTDDDLQKIADGNQDTFDRLNVLKEEVNDDD